MFYKVVNTIYLFLNLLTDVSIVKTIILKTQFLKILCCQCIFVFCTWRKFAPFDFVFNMWLVTEQQG